MECYVHHVSTPFCNDQQSFTNFIKVLSCRKGCSKSKFNFNFSKPFGFVSLGLLYFTEDIKTTVVKNKNQKLFTFCLMETRINPIRNVNQ